MIKIGKAIIEYITKIILFKIIIVLIIPISFSKNNAIKRKLQENYHIEMLIKFKEIGRQNLLSNNFMEGNPPDKVIINGNEQIADENKQYRIDTINSKIIIIWNSPLESSEKMFFGLNNLISVNVTKFDSSLITNSQSMFKDCKSLEFLNFSGFDLSSDTSIHTMFENCESLIILDVSNLKTNNVENMGGAFRNCYSLISINLSGFLTENAKQFAQMFYQCRN